MKKLVFLFMAFLVSAFPIMAQNMISVDVPVEKLDLSKKKIPTAIVNAADKLFEGNTQVAWGKFPYELKKYGWAVEQQGSTPIDHYEIQIKAKNGSDIFAVLDSKGELLRYKIVEKNVAPPKSVLTALENSKYKDWKIVGDVMHIKYRQNDVDEQISLNLKKGNRTKNVTFKVDGIELENM